MYCTGGIRCEKAASYLNSKGYNNVYQLEGGILNYLKYKKKYKRNNLWKGECFVLDDRVTVKKNLKQGNYFQCHGCRRPLKAKDKKSIKYIPGASCSYCYYERTKVQKERSFMRLSQIKKYEEKGLPSVFRKIR